MMLLIFGGLLVLGIFWMFTNKISVDIQSFLRKTIPLERGKFGVYCFTGKQGSGKTYSLVKYIRKHVKKDTKVYSNITMKGVSYTQLTSLEQLLALRDEENCFIVYDEIFTILQKQSKISAELMEFLTQQRKMHNIFFTTAQEWLEIPITFRRFVRIQIDCKTFPLGRWGGLLVEKYSNGYEIKWDQMQNEYVAPLMSMKISKYEKRFMKAYDTFERIRGLR